MMSIISNRKGFEMSFATIFAIIVGAVIIFFAIFATTRLIDSERTQTNTEVGKEIGILLTPVETNLESAKVVKLILPSEAKIFNGCNKFSGNPFGNQEISVSIKSGVGDEWIKPGIPSSFHNKYLFSSDVSEGETFEIFTKPFEMPFKIADLTFLWSDKEKFCFINPTGEIESEILDLNLKGIDVVNDIKSCSLDSKKVCFTSSGCDIDVDVNSKSVKKKRRTETVYYEGPLIYGAILSSPKIYECQVERLLGRASELSSVYIGKSSLLSSKGCGSERLIPLISKYSNKTFNIESSIELREINLISKEIGGQNKNLGCKLF